MPIEYPILDTAKLIDEAKRYATGLQARDYTRQPYGSLGFGALPFPLIPREQWKERLEEMERKKATLPQICDRVQLGVKNQGRTNYCWINAPVHALEIVRVIENQPKVSLSPASVGAIIKNFQNVGGWGSEGLRFLAEKGCVPSSLWPDTAIDRKYNTAEANAERQKYRVTEWWELKPRNFEELATCLLMNVPVAVGYNWWGHEVTAVSLTYKGGDFGIVIDNSWGPGWENNGRGVLLGKKALPDDAVCPRVAIAA